MTGSHEVRSSILLGSINCFNKLGAAHGLPLTVLCAYSVPSPILETAQHIKYMREMIEGFDTHSYVGTIHEHPNRYNYWVVLPPKT
jgi:hypothetical protein